MIEQCQAPLEPALAASEPFRRFLRDWVAGRLPDDPILTALVVNSTFAVAHTAYRAWRPEDGHARFEDQLRYGFDTLGAGLLAMGVAT